jgi:hypothetical protein
MWKRVTLGLIALLALLLALLTATGNLSVKVDVDLPKGSAPISPLWMAGWVFILFSAVIIIAVTAIRLLVRCVQFLRRGISN